MLVSCAAQAGAPERSIASSPPLLEATVHIADFEPTWGWLPTQFAPKLVEHESVSLVDVWPMEGDRVIVLCATEGEEFIDKNAHYTNDWYGIFVPADKIDPAAIGRAERVPGGYRAYVGRPWLQLTQTPSLLPC